MWDIKLKATCEQTWKQINKNSYTQITVWWGPDVKDGESKGDQMYGDGRRLTLGDVHMMQYTDDASSNCTVETSVNS